MPGCARRREAQADDARVAQPDGDLQQRRVRLPHGGAGGHVVPSLNVGVPSRSVSRSSSSCSRRCGCGARRMVAARVAASIEPASTPTLTWSSRVCRSVGGSSPMRKTVKPIPARTPRRGRRPSAGCCRWPGQACHQVGGPEHSIVLPATRPTTMPERDPVREGGGQPDSPPMVTPAARKAKTGTATPAEMGRNRFSVSRNRVRPRGRPLPGCAARPRRTRAARPRPWRARPGVDQCGTAANGSGSHRTPPGAARNNEHGQRDQRRQQQGRGGSRCRTAR